MVEVVCCTKQRKLSQAWQAACTVDLSMRWCMLLSASAQAQQCEFEQQDVEL